MNRIKIFIYLNCFVPDVFDLKALPSVLLNRSIVWKLNFPFFSFLTLYSSGLQSRIAGYSDRLCVKILTLTCF